ncbi:hypothetical protein [Flavobacterium sp. 123]|uniref:hypothetical protein n=1 Tax=Flavobacterium sp. 123 TaxID=2135627 RepID=UPI000F0F7034|nr:hypothetical protein [Flavobacterium sp. 123]RKT00074.1 hypothetical protein C8C88_1889 [Flavobacterium sp. 123]
MEIDWTILSIILIGLIVLIVLVIKKNQKDKKDYTHFLNNDFKKAKEEEVNPDNDDDF